MSYVGHVGGLLQYIKGPFVGDRMQHKETGQECEVAYYYPLPDDRYLIRHIATGMSYYNTVARVDIWNYYSMWPGTQEEMGNDPKGSKRTRPCEHKLVNVSFMGINMRCKYCDMDEDQVRADMERRRNDYTDPTGY